MSILPDQRDDDIAYLLERKFGMAVFTVLSGRAEDKEDEQLRAKAQAYRAELQGLSEEQRLAQVRQQMEKDARLVEVLEEQARFFNQPNASADFKYWGGLALWTLDEGVALTLGKDPRVVTWAKIEECAETSQFAADFANLRRFVHRAKEAQQLTDPVSPADYIAWAKANGVAVPPDLEESVQASSGKVPDWKALYKEEKLKLASVTDELERLKAADKPLSEKEKRTFYKLFLGMAVAFHGYDPHASRSAIPKEIADELERHGFSISDDTVRDKLQKAAEVYGDLVPKLDEN